MNKKDSLEKDTFRSYDAKKKIVYLGTKQMIKNQLIKNSYINLFFSSVKFIGLKVWTIQLIIISSCLYLLYSDQLGNFEDVLKGLTGLITLSIIFFSDELFKSFTNNMWELEQTFKYDLRQHITMKLLIFGIFDFMVIILLSLIGNNLFPITFINFALFLLAPFNIICIILFSIFTLLRNVLSNTILWSCSGILVALLIIVTSLCDIYSLPINYWIITYIATSLGLWLVAKQMMQRQNRGGLF